MYCYKDKTYCLASDKNACDKLGIKVCENRKACYRNIQEYNNRPTEFSFAPACIADMHDTCEDYMCKEEE